MDRINYIYQTVQTVLNKNSKGVLSPERFNVLATMAQSTVVGSLINEYRDAINRRRINRGGPDIRELETALSRYLVTKPLTVAAGETTMPDDLSYLPTDYLFYNDALITEIPSNEYTSYISGIVTPSVTYPRCKVFGNKIKIFPNTINAVTINYYRRPLSPKWTYTTVNNEPVFDGSKADYQDIDVYENKIPDVIFNILELSGVHLRDAEVVQVMEAMKTFNYRKDLQ